MDSMSSIISDFQNAYVVFLFDFFCEKIIVENKLEHGTIFSFILLTIQSTDTTEQHARQINRRNNLE